MAEPTLWISEAEVVSALDLGEAIEALAGAFAGEAAGQVVPLEKTMTAFSAPGGGHGTLHALGAAFPGQVGAKTWSHTPGGADPVLLLFDAASGALLAVIEAFALGQLRTSGTAGLATDRLARPDARVLAVIGTGKQALPQVAAVAAVREIEQVRAYSPNPQRRAAFAERVTAELGLPARAAGSTAEAVDAADVVTLVTRATQPVLTEDMIAPGIHVNAVGAIDLARREFAPAILARASVVTDSLSQVRNLSAELRDFYGADVWPWPDLRTLGEVVRGDAGRAEEAEVTLFKGMGSGVEDLALGTEVLARVRKAGGGVEVTRSGRAAPRLRRRRPEEAK